MLDILIPAAAALVFAAPATTLPASAIEGTLSGRALQKNVQIVYLEKVGTPDATKPTEGAVLDQRGNTYVPHVLPIVAGSSVEIRTSDPELHNVYAQQGDAVLFNSGMPAGAPPRTRVFEERGVVHLTCSIHKEMSAYVVVLQNRFFTAPGKSGAFRIDSVPPGTYKLRIWGERLDETLAAKSWDVTVPGSGAVTLSITPGA